MAKNQNQNRGGTATITTLDESSHQEVADDVKTQESVEDNTASEQTESAGETTSTEPVDEKTEAQDEQSAVEASASVAESETLSEEIENTASSEPEVDAAGNPISEGAPAVETQQSGDQEIAQQQADVQVQETLVAAVAPEEVPAAQKAAALESVFARLPKLSPVGRVVADAIDNYIREMTPGRPMTVQVGVMHQSRLYRALILSINNLVGEEFHDVFSAILKAFAEHSGDRGVFGEKFVFRFPESINGDSEQQSTFHALLTMFIALGPVASRQASLKQINVLRCLKGGDITEAGRNKVLGYFEI